MKIRMTMNTSVKHIKVATFKCGIILLFFVKGKCFLILPFFISKQHDPWQNSTSFCLCHSNTIRFKSVAIVSRTKGIITHSIPKWHNLYHSFRHMLFNLLASLMFQMWAGHFFFFFFQQWWLKVGKTQCLIQYSSTDLKVKTSGLVYYIIV